MKNEKGFINLIPLLVVLALGTAVNVANDHATNLKDVKASVIKQVTHPVISPATVYNK